MVISINDYGGEYLTVVNEVKDAREATRVPLEDSEVDQVVDLWRYDMSNESIPDKILGKVGEILIIPVAIVVLTALGTVVMGVGFWDLLPVGFSVGLTFFISAVLGIGVLLIIWFFSAVAGSMKKTTSSVRTQKVADIEEAVMQYCMLMLMVEAGEARLVDTQGDQYTFAVGSDETVTIRRPPLDEATENMLMGKLKQMMSKTNGDSS